MLLLIMIMRMVVMVLMVIMRMAVMVLESLT